MVSGLVFAVGVVVVVLQLAGHGAEAGESKPEQVHLALAGRDAEGNSNGMTFQWYTEKGTETRVQYGTSEGALDQEVTGKSERYYDGHGHHHRATAEGLALDTRYYYRVGDGEHWSEVRSFRTGPGSLDASFGVSVFGDMGWLGSKERPMVLHVEGLKKEWTAVPTRERLERLREAGAMDMVWHVGDIGYADDAFAHDVVGGVYEKCYNGFMNWMENITATMPYMVSPGNHESECHSPACLVDRSMGKQLSNFSAYNTRWAMPSRYSGGVMSMWYSWNYGPVHFVSIDSETDFAGAGEEHKGDGGAYPAGGFGREGEYLAWLEADLKAAHEARVKKTPGYRPFIVAGGHRWCCTHIPGHQALFDKYHVDLYVAGHAHRYGRSYRSCTAPVCHSHEASNGTTTYLFAGGAGNDETVITKHGPSPQPGNATFETSELATGLLRVNNRSSLTWQLIASYDGRVIDEFHLDAQTF